MGSGMDSPLDSTMALSKTGKVALYANNGMGIDSSETIDITSHMDLKLKSENGAVRAQGNIKHKNFEVLA